MSIDVFLTFTPVTQAALPNLTFPLQPGQEYESPLGFHTPANLLPSIAARDTRGLFETIDAIELTLNSKDDSHAEVSVVARVTVE